MHPSLQSRVLALFVLLILGVQLGGFVLVNSVGGAAARDSIGEDLVAGARVFHRLLDEDTQRLLQGARVLAADYAFREAVATRDRETVRSALVNHGRRIDADIAMVVDLDERVVATTLDDARGEPFPFGRLLVEARQRSRAAAIVVVQDKLFQLAIVPVLAPLPVAWIAVGFEVDDGYAQDLRGLTRFDVSFLSRHGKDAWALQASTLPEAGRLPLLVEVSTGHLAGSDKDGNTMLGEAVTRILPLGAASTDTVVAVLQQPLAAALEPFRRLQRQLAWTSLLAVAISLVAGLVISRGIARPVRELAAVARRIAAGDYSMLPPHSDTREIAELAAAFRTMQHGIATRETQIMELAYRDTLTGLPNRTLCAERLERAIQSADSHGTALAVLLMDLDRFRDVNDTLGHPIGDLLLREVANRLGTVVRRDSDTVARLGGDEFAVLLPGDGPVEAKRVAQAILAALEAPMTLAGHPVDVRASIGIALFPDHGHEVATLLRHADVALYAAKRLNGGIVQYDERHDRHGRERLTLMSDLRKALEQDELTLVFQPKIALREAGGGHHVEALLRWRHAVRGVVPPGEFIPFAEQTGTIREVTRWVVEHAIAQCAAWRAGNLPMHVSINLSARDVMDAELPDRVMALLERHGCAARWIAFEITESAILDDPSHAVANLNRLSALGCRIAIDDYGTGYSSLAYLRTLPISEIKIDKSFVSRMSSDANDDMIVRSTIELAHNMRLSVVAEGVEDEATLDRLRALGCDVAQGFLVGRPMDALQLVGWVRESPWTQIPREATALRRVV